MKKKILVAILAVCLIIGVMFSLVACNSGDTTTTYTGKVMGENVSLALSSNGTFSFTMIREKAVLSGKNMISGDWKVTDNLVELSNLEIKEAYQTIWGKDLVVPGGLGDMVSLAEMESASVYLFDEGVYVFASSDMCSFLPKEGAEIDKTQTRFVKGQDYWCGYDFVFNKGDSFVDQPDSPATVTNLEYYKVMAGGKVDKVNVSENLPEIDTSKQTEGTLELDGMQFTYAVCDIEADKALSKLIEISAYEFHVSGSEFPIIDNVYYYGDSVGPYNATENPDGYKVEVEEADLTTLGKHTATVIYKDVKKSIDYEVVKDGDLAGVSPDGLVYEAGKTEAKDIQIAIQTFTKTKRYGKKAIYIQLDNAMIKNLTGLDKTPGIKTLSFTLAVNGKDYECKLPFNFCEEGKCPVRALVVADKEIEKCWVDENGVLRTSNPDGKVIVKTQLYNPTSDEEKNGEDIKIDAELFKKEEGDDGYVAKYTIGDYEYIATIVK